MVAERTVTHISVSCIGQGKEEKRIALARERGALRAFDPPNREIRFLIAQVSNLPLKCQTLETKEASTPAYLSSVKLTSRVSNS